MTEHNTGEDKKRAVRAQIRNGGLALLALIVMMLWLSGAFVSKVGPRSAASKTAGLSKNPALQTVRVTGETFPLIVEQVGTIRSKNEAEVSSHLMAQVRQIRVAPGEWVKGPEKGAEATVLATLDDRAVEEKLRQAQSQVVAIGAGVDAARANMEKGESDYRRYENLLKNGATTAQRAQYAKTRRDVAAKEVARLQAQKKQAEATEREATVMLSYTVIRAPFTGRVVTKLLDVGDMAAPGRPLFFIDAPSLAEVHAVVSESVLPYLKVGRQIEVSIDAIHRTLTGKIREIVPQADNSTRTVQVKITLPASADLVNGLFARIYVPCGSYHALVIPAAAVQEVGELYLVDTVDSKGRMERRFIRPGRTRGKLIEVLSGLKAGEEVVVP
ncbi:MAG: efflux RND transporter periplasmic adaptor subunit [Syntrophobacteraceae bacterium]|nr:efflux RND transporter periplasmic adaptor subunit [Syntrophobacteraceae bacterium]